MTNWCNRMFQPFDTANIPHIVDVVLPLWGVPERGGRLNRICVEYIVRKNIFENGLGVQYVSDGEFCAAAFACKTGDANSAEQWLSRLRPPLTDAEARNLALSRTYIEAMDARTFSLMRPDDAKLSLFVSHTTGTGLPVFAELTTRLARRGFKNLFLWTDIDCTWEWYSRHGFTLVEEGVYDAFSGDVPYRTFIFCKQIRTETEAG